METVPMDIEGVSVAWLDAQLRGSGALASGRLMNVGATRIARGESLFGRLHRLTLEYDAAAPAAAPRTLICKQPTAGQFNALAMTLRLYERECRFYAELAARCPLGTPRAHVARFEGGDRAILVLEDLAALTSHDQLRGMPAAAAADAVASLARFHAEFWARTGAYDWIPVQGELPGESALRQAAASGFGRVVDATPALWTAPRRAMFEAYLAGKAPVGERLARAPHTLVHGDFRANNLFFRDDGQLVAIDWQGLTRGNGAYDVGYLLSQSLSSECRRGFAEDPVHAYHRELCTRGVAGYDLQTCLDDVAAAILVGMGVVVMANSAAREFRPEMAHFLTTMLGRALDAAEDYRAAERLGLA